MIPYCKENDALFDYIGLSKYKGKVDLSIGGGIVFFGIPREEKDMQGTLTYLTDKPSFTLDHDTFFVRAWHELQAYFNSTFPIYVVPTQPTEEDYQNIILPQLLEKRPTVGTFLYDGVGRNRDYLYEPTADFLTLFAAEGNRGAVRYTLATDDKYVLGVTGAIWQNGKIVPRADASISPSVTCAALTPAYVPYTNHALSPYPLNQSCAGATVAALMEYVRKCYIKHYTGKDVLCEESETFIKAHCTKIGAENVTGAGLFLLPGPEELEIDMLVPTNEKIDELLKSKNPPDSWAANDAAWANINGIITGDENGEMHWQENVTRQEMASMLRRLADKIKE